LGSVVFYEKSLDLVIGGDVLFAGGIGRWDLPGGSQSDLVSGIKKHLWPLPDKTKVCAGHGPATTIGREKLSNGYLQ
jgi:glyoxylase-like metal-dependent hydrolase (beta-lactamase superfamily II)